MVKALAQAFRWRKMLDEGEYTTLEDLARARATRCCLSRAPAGGGAVRADRIIVMRHAQKPTQEPKHIGIREDGTADPESLTVCGWQHAGALAAVVAGPHSDAALAFGARPDVIFAAGAGKKKVRVGGKEVEVGSHSRRPVQTVTPLAETLELSVVTTYTKGEEPALVADALGRPGTVLICWQHENIVDIGNLITGNTTTVPQSWPEEQYEVIYIFDRAGEVWSFREFSHGRLFTS